jgi:histidinol-phosphatase
MTTSFTSGADLDLAHRLADAAAEISMAHVGREIRRWAKEDGSLATEADVAVEDALRAMLGRERPGDAVLGEERGESGRGHRRWIVDGIDGTNEFARGSPDWGTLIALEIDGCVVLGVCDQPAHRRRYWAVRGGGAFRSAGAAGAAQPLRVSPVNSLAAARSYVPPPEWLPDERARQVARAMTAATKPEPHVDHPALQLAAGGYDLVMFCLAGPWDLAAPSVIVEEAGGRFTDLDGHASLTSGHALFSNGVLHEEILRLLAGVPPRH